MSHRSIGRNAKQLLGQNGRGPCKACDIAGAGSRQSGVGAMGAAQSEIDEQLVGCEQHHARCFGGDQGLKMQNVDEARLDKLCFRERSSDAQNRLVPKEYTAFPNGMHLAAEAEFCEIIDQRCIELARSFEPAKFFIREAQISEEIERAPSLPPSESCVAPAVCGRRIRIRRFRSAHIPDRPGSWSVDTGPSSARSGTDPSDTLAFSHQVMTGDGSFSLLRQTAIDLC